MSAEKKDEGKTEASFRWCAACGEKLDPDHPGIRCQQSHHLCNDCSATYKHSILTGGPQVFPPKCGFCGAEVNLLSFERQLTGTDADGERSVFLTYMMMQELEEGEVLSRCPFCPYFCTRLVAELSQHNFVHCQNPSCFKVSCSLCFKQCVPIDDDDEEEDQAVKLGMDMHFICAEREASLGALRREMQTAIDKGITPCCPTCGHRGTKDDACTHMTCEMCHTVWCYVCGLDVTSDACDKSEGGGEPEYRHNTKWFENERRCPMYLSQINSVDESFPEDEEEAKEMLHRKLALRNMRQVYDRIGAEKYKQLISAYPTLGSASGFTEDDIKAVDLCAPVFKRAEPGEFDADSDDDDDIDENSD